MKTKRIIGVCQAVLAVGILMLFFLNCLVIDPVKGVDLSGKSFNGFKAYLGYTSDFAPSVGGVMTVVFLSIVLVLAILKTALPKLSIIWNSIIAFFALFVAIFLFCGTTSFMINEKNNILSLYGWFSDIKLGVGAILGGIIGILILAASICDEVLAYRAKNR